MLAHAACTAYGVAHPDIAGPAAGPLAVLLNAAYATLADEGMADTYRTVVKLAGGIAASTSYEYT